MEKVDDVNTTVSKLTPYQNLMPSWADQKLTPLELAVLTTRKGTRGYTLA